MDGYSLEKCGSCGDPVMPVVAVGSKYRRTADLRPEPDPNGWWLLIGEGKARWLGYEERHIEGPRFDDHYCRWAYDYTLRKMRYMSKIPLRQGDLEDVGLPKRVLNCLYRAGFAYQHEVAAMSDSNLLNLANFGKQALKQVRAAMADKQTPLQPPASLLPCPYCHGTGWAYPSEPTPE